MFAPNLIPFLMQSVIKGYFHREVSNMSNDFSYIFKKVMEDPNFYLADCFFEVEGKLISAHKVIVCTRCEYFR
jgi:hypothetical protein